jgi:hypothetical protein
MAEGSGAEAEFAANLAAKVGEKMGQSGKFR